MIPNAPLPIGQGGQYLLKNAGPKARISLISAAVLVDLLTPTKKANRATGFEDTNALVPMECQVSNSSRKSLLVKVERFVMELLTGMRD